MFKNLIFALIVAIPFSVVNFNGYLMGGPPTQAQVIASFLFNMIWLLFGLIMAIKARRNFITFTTLYWIVGGLLGASSYWFESLEMALIPVFIFAGPSYGLNLLLDLPSDKGLLIACIVISYALSLLGYCLGRLIMTMNQMKSNY